MSKSLGNDKKPGTETRDPPGFGKLPAVTAPATEVWDLDRVFDTLAHSRRRYVCYTLLENTEWPLDELARKVAAWENDISEQIVTAQQQMGVYVSLYHAHIPKLVEAGILSFDDATETVTPAENAEQVLLVLEGVRKSLDSNQTSRAREELLVPPG